MLLQLSLISIIQNDKSIVRYFAVIQTINTMNYFVILVLNIFNKQKNCFFFQNKHKNTTHDKNLDLINEAKV